MSEYRLPLEPDNFYHIYNRGINGCKLFNEAANYGYFMGLYQKYITPVAETYAWVLMGNHFHLLVRINQQFSNLFNAYSKAFNKRYHRTGSLFEHRFRRKLVADEQYLKQLVVYIHNNPVKHGFCRHPKDYAWSSYLTCISHHNTQLMRNAVLQMFTNTKEFIMDHEKPFDYFNFDTDLGMPNDDVMLCKTK